MSRKFKHLRRKAEALAADILAATDLAVAGDQNLLTKLSKIREGDLATDPIQDLSDITVIVEKKRGSAQSHQLRSHHARYHPGVLHPALAIAGPEHPRQRRPAGRENRSRQNLRRTGENAGRGEPRRAVCLPQRPDTCNDL
jgi:hypothetical protein